MNHKYTNKEKKYLESFLDTSLNIQTFHHKEHLLITYVLLVDNDIDTCYKKIKAGILNVLNHVGVDTTKYHETMTYAWVLIVKYFMQITLKSNSFEEFISQNKKLLDVNILYKHYSKELISKEKARLNILSADIQDIPIK